MKNKVFNKKNAAAGLILTMALLGATPVFQGNSTVAEAAKKRIGVAAAKEKALADAEVSSSKAKFTKAKLKYDDGIRYYDIEFYTSNAEYDYEIHAYTGRVLERDYEKIKKPVEDKRYIGVSKAKQIALKDAGFSSSEVDFVKAKLDKEDGERVYEIEFYSGRMEYEYTIDAYTGEILEWDSGYDD